MKSNFLVELLDRYPLLLQCEQQVQAAHDMLAESFRAGGKCLICGNGGSAADADHITGELLKGFGHPRPLGAEDRAVLKDDALADNLQGALPSIPLTAFSALSTAYANDCDGEYHFAQLTWGLAQQGDVLVCISTSGNSANVVHAAKVAKAKGVKTVGLTGAGGGKLFEVCDLTIRVPETAVFKIQELHLPVYHTLCFMLEETFFGAGSY